MRSGLSDNKGDRAPAASLGVNVKLLIDGYNVIFAETHRPLPRVERELEQMRDDLLRRLEDFRTAEGIEITVVFDGGEAGAHLARFQHVGGIEVIFSDPKSDADEEIKTYLRQSSHARDMRLITDDRPLAQSSKNLGARVAGTAWLIEHMQRSRARRGSERASAEPACKFGGTPESEVDRWTEVFGDLDESDFDKEGDVDE